MMLQGFQTFPNVAHVVQGLVYLHAFETPIIGSDLKFRNALDFKKMDEETLTNGIGTYQWMAPEIFTGHDYSTAVDVYPLGTFLGLGLKEG
ncbi:hypothetical protein SDRG_13000 [Saprolegnia diclina VS20]|uniref:Protein kinase domain-containing protein n=1 Tax=Saprolegnia diclina (strain VS20) TaxID=1156394 RepID=T0Q411_SAPDV|nr:hypothetical protein SDRG_13000 [Saprolegnia diclina VS20]EQC29331.1 hypothetical protein SDRG_13000 [Saprolegnia diclina VS20]|eukprot:XP_008617305.1 hypothetical protein SDRG_13000 [Saprolegnia diclina VS20]